MTSRWLVLALTVLCAPGCQNNARASLQSPAPPSDVATDAREAMAGLAESVGMRVIISEHKDTVNVRAGRTSFADTLRQSDVLTLHCPLTDQTRDLIGPAEFQMMKRTALLINTARGALVDDAALIDALRNGLIAGAGLDALREEPPRHGGPLLDLNLTNLIITPHVAWASREAVQTLADQVIDNIEGFIAGRPRNLLT